MFDPIPHTHRKESDDEKRKRFTAKFKGILPKVVVFQTMILEEEPQPSTSSEPQLSTSAESQPSTSGYTTGRQHKKYFGEFW